MGEDMIWYLQWIGCAFGIIGASLLALNNAHSGWGFVAFLGSNTSWILFGVLTEAPGLVFMQIAFTATSVLGIYRWLLSKPENFRMRKSMVERVPRQSAFDKHA